jgi:hypothetical protein
MVKGVTRMEQPAAAIFHGDGTVPGGVPGQRDEQEVVAQVLEFNGVEAR